MALEEGFGLKEELPSNNISTGTNFHFQSESTSAVAECDRMNQMNATSLFSSLPHSWATLCLFVRVSLCGVCYARWAAKGSPARYTEALIL